MKLLIIDDSDLIRTRVKNRIAKEATNLEIFEAVNGRDGIGKCSIINPDIITIDLSMPDLTGVNVLENVKNIAPKSKILIFTNYPYEELRQFTLSHGADYFFYKASDFEELIMSVCSLAKAKVTEC